MTNDIPAIQNEDVQLRRLGAQRQLYSKAKAIFAVQLISAVPISMLLTILAFTFERTKPFTTIWGLGLVLVDVLWLSPWMKHLKQQAAKIQEEFDCDVLHLPWAEVKVGKKVENELVFEQSEKYAIRAGGQPPLTDWYRFEVGVLPIHAARVICQRTNCWWDSKQRRRYGNSILAFCSTAFVTALVVSLYQNPSLGNFVSQVLGPLAPLLVFGARHFSENRETADRLDSLKEHIEKLWMKILESETPEDATKASRDIQNEIFENRRKSPLVFDRVFKFFRDDFEMQTRNSVESFVAEFNRAQSLKE